MPRWVFKSKVISFTSKRNWTDSIRTQSSVVYNPPYIHFVSGLYIYRLSNTVAWQELTEHHNCRTARQVTVIIQTTLWLWPLTLQHSDDETLSGTLRSHIHCGEMTIVCPRGLFISGPPLWLICSKHPPPLLTVQTFPLCCWVCLFSTSHMSTVPHPIQ